MGHNQILVILFCFIILGVGVGLGLSLYGGHNATANKQSILEDLYTLGSDAYEYKIRPGIMGGGSGSYIGYSISPASTWGSGNPNATYTISTISPTKIVVTGTSKAIAGASVSVTFDQDNNIESGPTASGF